MSRTTKKVNDDAGMPWFTLYVVQAAMQAVIVLKCPKASVTVIIPGIALSHPVNVPVIAPGPDVAKDTGNVAMPPPSWATHSIAELRIHFDNESFCSGTILLSLSATTG